MALTKISTAMISQDAASVDLNIDAGTLYIDSTNNRVGVANTSPATALDVTGTITADTIKLGDNQRVQIGDGQDFQFYHDGSNSYILATGGSGSLITRADVFGVQDSSNINMIEAASTTGVVTLYYNTGSTSAARLATSSTGVSITGNLTTTGYIAGPATFTIDPAAVGDNTGTVVIAGNLQVDGTTTTINSTTMTVDDLNITLASGAANAAAANGAGITVDGASATITYDGTNDEWDFNKDINVTGTLTASGGSSNNDSTANILTLNASEHARLVVDTSSTGGHRATLALKSNGNETQLTTTGSASFLNVASGNLTVDVAGNIILDADAGEIQLKDGGTEFGQFAKSGNDFRINQAIQDGDIVFRGNDGGSIITALTLDMSEAGEATFNAGIKLGDGYAAQFGASQDLLVYHSSNENIIQANTSDQDLLFKGNDGGSIITALTLDMSNAGFATFNDGITLKKDLFINNADGSATVGYLYNDSNDFVIRSYTLNQDIIFKGNDGGSVIEAMRIDMSAGGNVGIGDTDPDWKFTVEGSAADDWISRIYNTATDGAGLLVRTDATSANDKIAFAVYADSGYKMAVKSTGNVGIGTTSPNSPLHVLADAGSSNSAVRIRNSNTTGRTTTLQLEDYSGALADGVLKFVFPNAGSTTGSYLGLLYNSAGLYVAPGGNVGIGTTTPDSNLHIKSSNDVKLTLETDEDSDCWINLSGATSEASIGYEPAGNKLMFANAADGVTSNVRMTIDSSGNVGIGTTSPSYKFDIYGTDDVTMRIHRPSSGLASTDTCGIGFSHRGDANTSTSDTRAGIFSTYNGTLFLATEPSGDLNSNPMDHAALTITGTDQNVGIGTTSPEQPLHVREDDSTAFAASSNMWHTIVVSNENTTGTTRAAGLAFELAGYHENAGTGIAAVKNGTASDYGADLVFITRPQSAVAQERMRIDSLGNVGIGISSQNANQKLIIKTVNDTDKSQGLVIERSNASDRGYINYQGGAFRMIATDGDPIRFGHVSDSDRVTIGTSGELTTGSTITNNGNITNNSSGHAYLVLNNGGSHESGIVLKKNGTNKWEGPYISSSNDNLKFYSYGDSSLQMTLRDGVNANGGLELRGLGISDGTAHYGHYGALFLDSSSNYTGSARSWMITNAYTANQFAILYGSSAGQFPVLGTGGGAGTNTSVALSIQNNGVARFHGDLQVGGDIAMDNGRGISFSATGQASGMSSELLDDYEEGTFSSSTTSNNVTSYGTFTGRYTKIGNIVHLSGQLAGITAGTGNRYFTFAAPFVQYANINVSIGVCMNYPEGNRRSGVVINNSSGNNTEFFVGWNNDSAQSNDDVRFQITYETSA